jgi:transposase-like protein
MKSVCKYCGQGQLIKWGDRRRYCQLCGKTFSVAKAGRNSSRKIGMYLLDRSTFRRIGFKSHRLHTTVMRGLHKELAPVPTPLEHLKKI